MMAPIIIGICIKMAALMYSPIIIKIPQQYVRMELIGQVLRIFPAELNLKLDFQVALYHEENLSLLQIKQYLV